VKWATFSSSTKKHHTNINGFGTNSYHGSEAPRNVKLQISDIRIQSYEQTRLKNQHFVPSGHILNFEKRQYRYISLILVHVTTVLYAVSSRFVDSEL